MEAKTKEGIRQLITRLEKAIEGKKICQCGNNKKEPYKQQELEHLRRYHELKIRDIDYQIFQLKEDT